MKKNFFLTLVLAVLCTAASWAQFAPEAGKMYAFREVTSGLFLDIQTLGINEPNANGTTNNISLSAKPCVIYFGASNGKYTMKNVNGTYAQQASSRDWNAVIGSDAYQWTILDSDNDGYYTIARADGKFVKMDKATNGAPLYCDSDAGLEFALVEYSNIIPGVYTVKTATGTYLTQEVHTTLGTKATFQATAENFKIMPSGNLFYFENNDVAGQYLGTTHEWNATFDFSLLQIVNIDVDGFATIVRANAPNLQIGSDDNTNVGTGIFTNINKDKDKISNKWYFEGTYDYPTVGTVNSGKYHFTSDYITYAGACNKIRFTLTESGAYYKNGVKRLSFDSFELYDADGKKVELTAANVTGNNIASFTNMLDGADGTYASCAWDTPSATDDWFEILLPKNVDLGGAFKFSFVTENTTMNAKKFTINTSYEKPADYTVVINAPQGESVNVTYDGKNINTDDKVTSVGFDKSLIDATNISGYTWSVIVNEEENSVTIQYTAAAVVENPDAVVALIKRVGGESAAEQFKFVLDPSINSKNEVFVIGGEDGKVLIKGTTISAITTGIGWYLNNYAHINIAWNSLNEKTVSGDKYADLSNIPVPTTTETRTSDAMYRYYLNTCVFGYSMTTWTWKRWQQEIDWMALHGVNMPLQLVGLEEVWRKFLTMEDENGNRKYKYTDAQAKAFVPGPAFIAWWAMNNLQGWGGTAKGDDVGANNGNNSWDGSGGVQDDAWYARQKNLAKQITDRQRELGMQPVLPGWSGMVPANFASISGYATRANGGWNGGFVRPLLLNVSNANYAEIAADYYACLHDVMGESQYYSMDPFHEGGGAGTMEDYKALYAAMEAAKPGSKWVIQQWQWSETQGYSLTAVPAGRLIVLDLFADGNPAFDKYNGFAPQDAVFSIIPNFGGRSGLMGRLTNLTDNYFKYKKQYASIKGIGAAPEAIEQTPVTYDLLFQLAWMDSKPNVAEWVSNYSIARYGVENEEIKEAWSLLRQGPLNYGVDAIQGPVEDVWAAIPNLTATPASTWGKTLNAAGGTYTKERRQMLIDATYKLLSQNEALNFTDGSIYESNYKYDLVEFGGAVLADYAYDLLLGIASAKTSAGDAYKTNATYTARRDAFLQLIADVDEFKGTNLNFRLGKWTQEARAAAQEAIALGATSATADWYEYNNARTIISTWSSPDATTCLGDFNARDLNDYSYRSWQGMMKDYYLPRWKHFFENGCKNVEYDYFEWNWAHGKEHYVGQTAKSDVALTAQQTGHSSKYTREPEGNTVEKAIEVLGKYIIPLKTDNGTTYAYRYLTNTLSAEYKVEGVEGGTIDMSKFFLANIDGATVTGDFINGTANDIKAVPVKSDIAGNTYDAVMTLTDGTVLNFKVDVQQPEEPVGFNGVYHIVYNGAPVFVANDDNQALPSISWYKLAGYKLLDGTLDNTDEGDREIQNNLIASKAVADALFTIVPNGDASGYTLSAQGLYLHSTPDQTNGEAWSPLALSNDENKAGVYLFVESDNEYKLKCNISDVLNYVNDWGTVFGNNSASDTYARFSLTQVTEYTLTVPANGVTTLCLPFNVVLPTGVIAYDLTKAKISSVNGSRVYELATVATEGQTLAKNTPVIIKAAKGDHTLAITMNGEGAKVSTAGTVLRSGLVKTTVAAGNNYTFDGVNFNIVTADTEIAANQCWMELDENFGDVIYKEAPSIAVRLTTDEENPVLYKIIIKRANDNSKVLSYDEPTSEKVKIVDNTANSSYQAWYFVQGENGIMIKPYNADGRMLTVESTGDGADKAMIAADGASNFQEWSFTKSTQDGCTDYYYIKVVGDGNAGTFSHNGGFGVTSYMGIWADGFNSNDGGSLFKFVEAEFTNDNARFYQLNDVLPTLDQGIYTGESVGLYSADGVAALNTKCTEAQALVDAGSATSASADCYAAYKALRAAKKDAYNAPAADKVYYIVSTATGDGHAYCTGKYVHTYSEPHLHQNATWGDKTYDQHHLLFDAEGDIKQLSLAAFQFEETGTLGSYKMKNLHTGLYVKSFNKNAEHLGAEADAQVVTLVPVTDGQVALKIGNNDPMHAQNDYSVIVTWGAEANNPSTWTINEVEDMSELYTLNVPASGVTTLNLAFNVVLPQGVTAYDFVESDINEGEFALTQVAEGSDVLAKNTPVVIKASAGKYNLAVALSGENVKNGTANSVLRGNYWQTTVDIEHNYLPGIEEKKLVFTYATEDNKTAPANTVWASLTDKKSDKLVEHKETSVTPTLGKVYRIKSYVVNAENHYHYLVNNNASIQFPLTVEDGDKSAMWVCTSANEEEHKYKFVSAIGTAALGWQGAAEEAVEYTISEGVEKGTLALYYDGMYLALTTEEHNNGVKFNYATGYKHQRDVQHWSTDWMFEEVEDAEVAYERSFGEGLKWATLYLPYSVDVPDGVTAYYATSDGVGDNVINLKEVDKVPAYKAVLLYRGENATAGFSFAYEQNVDAAIVDGNIFEGRVMSGTVECVANHNYYLLLNAGNGEKFYWVLKEYDANGKYYPGQDKTHIKCEANKGYLKLPTQQGASSSYGFRIEGSTGIDEVKTENGEVKAIYDLQGRKLTEITNPGFYIVDGEKVLVK